MSKQPIQRETTSDQNGYDKRAGENPPEPVDHRPDPTPAPPPTPKREPSERDSD